MAARRLNQTERLKFMEEVGLAKLGPGPVLPGGPDEQAYLMLLHGEDPLDAGADFAAGRIHSWALPALWLIGRAAKVDLRNEDLALEAMLVLAAAIGGIRPNAGCGVAPVEQLVTCRACVC